jgi:hypothetical protein
MCRRTSGAMIFGMATVRNPAPDLGGPSSIVPSLSSAVRLGTRTSIVDRSKSTRRNPISSPHRSPVKAAHRISTRNRLGTASARANTCAIDATGRSDTGSWPAPAIRQGLRRMSSSSSAVFMMAPSNRYAFASVVADRPPSVSAVLHARTRPGGDVADRLVGARPVPTKVRFSLKARDGKAPFPGGTTAFVLIGLTNRPRFGGAFGPTHVRCRADYPCRSPRVLPSGSRIHAPRAGPT